MRAHMYVVALALLAFMIVYPVLTAEESPVPQLYINSIPSQDGPFIFTIEPAEAGPVQYWVRRVTPTSSELLESDILSMTAGHSEVVFVDINFTEDAARYEVILPQSGQKLHFWYIPNITETRRPQPEIDPYLPWEYQDPLVQAYYRYG